MNRRSKIPMPQFDETHWVNDNGAWRRPEDWCNTGPKGTGIRWTSSAVSMDEELFGACELGDRVADAMAEMAIDGWDALMDAVYAEYCEREMAARSSEDDLADTTMRGGAVW